uniref:Uncharacterized protein n=1 Tax=Octopus bimaculoides TaxID=37653 RepID=A0A0L8FZ98_OCTBM
MSSVLHASFRNKHTNIYLWKGCFFCYYHHFCRVHAVSSFVVSFRGPREFIAVGF